MCSHLSGRPLGNYSTIERKTNLSSQVSRSWLISNFKLIDDIKWAVRYPTRFAMRQPKLSYLEKVQEEVHNFLKTNIKHDFLKPDRELTLDLTLREAEILASAGEDVKIMAEKGDLRNLHERFRIIKEQVEVDYLKVRDHIDRIIVSIEEKENELYD